MLTRRIRQIICCLLLLLYIYPQKLHEISLNQANPSGSSRS